MRRRVCYVKYLETYGQLKIPVPMLAYVLSLWHKDVNYSEVKVRILQKYKMQNTNTIFSSFELLFGNQEMYYCSNTSRVSRRHLRNLSTLDMISMYFNLRNFLLKCARFLITHLP